MVGQNLRFASRCLTLLFFTSHIQLPQTTTGKSDVRTWDLNSGPPITRKACEPLPCHDDNGNWSLYTKINANTLQPQSYKSFLLFRYFPSPQAVLIFFSAKRIRSNFFPTAQSKESLLMCFL